MKKNYWIVGYGGISEALVDSIVSTGNTVTILTTKNNILKDNVSVFKLNNYSEEAIKSFISDELKISDLPDYILLTCGVLYDTNHMPEKSISSVDPEWLTNSVYANVVPSLLFAKYITKVLKKNSKLKMICFSARVSSISDNKSGGWHSYRMSKVMLNMLIKNICLEWKRKSPDSIIIGYHPGTVDTKLSKPFISNIDENKLFTPEQAAKYCLDIIEKLTIDKSGLLLDWNNKIINP